MTAPLDVLLVHPGGRKRTYQSLAADLAAVEPPLWASMLGGYLRSRGKSVGILDANADELDAAAVAESVAAIHPRVVAVVAMGQNPSSSTQTMPEAGAICRAIRQRLPVQVTALVGGHVAALPERTLREEAATFTVAGEGPVTLDSLVDCLKGTSLTATDFDKVPGLVRWTFGEQAIVERNPSPPLVTDMAMLTPAWDLLPMAKYRAHNWHVWSDTGKPRSPYAAIYTSLGCFASCSFCPTQAPFRDGEAAMGMSRNSFRFWEPELIGEQLEMLSARHGVRNVKVADEMFVYNRRHVEGVCDEILRRKLDLNLWAYARVDTCKDDRMLDKLAAAGFKWLAFGIESADADVRSGVDKGYKQSLIHDTLARVRARSIAIGANYIFGLPGDTFDTMQATLDTALEVNAEYSNFYCFQAIPGSPLYSQAVREGWDLPKSWGGYAQLSVDSYPMPTKTLDSAAIVRFRDRAFVENFTHPAYLAMLDRRFGPAAVAEVNAMTKLKLVRAA